MLKIQLKMYLFYWAGCFAWSSSRTWHTLSWKTFEVLSAKNFYLRHKNVFIV